MGWVKGEVAGDAVTCVRMCVGKYVDGWIKEVRAPCRRHWVGPTLLLHIRSLSHLHHRVHPQSFHATNVTDQDGAGRGLNIREQVMNQACVSA